MLIIEVILSYVKYLLFAQVQPSWFVIRNYSKLSKEPGLIGIFACLRGYPSFVFFRTVRTFDLQLHYSV